MVFIQTRLQALRIYGFCLSAAFLFKRRGFLLWCSPAALETYHLGFLVRAEDVTLGVLTFYFSFSMFLKTSFKLKWHI